MTHVPDPQAAAASVVAVAALLAPSLAPGYRGISEQADNLRALLRASDTPLKATLG